MVNTSVVQVTRWCAGWILAELLGPVDHDLLEWSALTERSRRTCCWTWTATSRSRTLGLPSTSSTERTPCAARPTTSPQKSSSTRLVPRLAENDAQQDCQEEIGLNPELCLVVESDMWLFGPRSEASSHPDLSYECIVVYVSHLWMASFTESVCNSSAWVAVSLMQPTYPNPDVFSLSL